MSKRRYRVPLEYPDDRERRLDKEESAKIRAATAEGEKEATRHALELREAKRVKDLARFRTYATRTRATRRVPASSVSRVTQVSNVLDWTVLPPGWWRSRRFSGGPFSRPNANEPVDIERIEFINDLAPAAWYEGQSLGTRQYFVAEFDGVVLAECADWGNALYYCVGRNDWRLILRRSKRDALSLGAKRILHKGDWRKRIRSIFAL